MAPPSSSLRVAMGDDLELDLDAAGLRADGAKLLVGIEVLARKLEEALPQATRVQRRNKRLFGGGNVVERVEARLGTARYCLQIDGDRVDAGCSQEVLDFLKGDSEEEQAAEDRRERDIARIEAGGIPLAAEGRLCEFAAGAGGVTSGLSLADFALTQLEAIRPVCQVMGTSVYKVGWQNHPWSGGWGSDARPRRARAPHARLERRARGRCSASPRRPRRPAATPSST